MKLIPNELMPPCPYCGGKSIQQGRRAGLGESCAMNLGIIMISILTLGIGLILFAGVFAVKNVPYCNLCRKRITDKHYIKQIKKLRKLKFD